MRPDMRVPIDVRVELRVAGLPVRGRLPAGIQGVQRGHRDGTDHVPDHQLDGVQHVRVDVVRRMVSDQSVGQLFAVLGHRPAERHRNRRRELHQAHKRLLSAGKSAAPAAQSTSPSSLYAPYRISAQNLNAHTHTKTYRDF